MDSLYKRNNSHKKRMVPQISRIDKHPENKIEERQVILNNFTWESYEQILYALPQKRSSHLTYDLRNIYPSISSSDKYF